MIVPIILFFVACSSTKETSSTIKASGNSKEACEITKPFLVKPNSRFPQDHLDVYRIVNAAAIAECQLGGFGWFISSWNLAVDVEVANLSFSKRFVIEDALGTLSDRIVMDPSEVDFRGTTPDGYDRFHFEQRSWQSGPIILSVIMPATFNATPNIGNPIPGWTGPTYGLSVVAAD